MDTEEGNGEQEEGQEDIGGWLEANNLDPFKEYFEETNMKFEDLLTWNEEDMNEIISESNVKAYVYKKRFKHKVREYQFKSNKLNAAASAPGTIYRVVVSSEEQKAMQTLKNKKNKIDELIKINEIEDR